MPTFFDGNVTSPTGFKASGISCGIKGDGRKDLALILSEVRASCGAAFTENSVKAAPVKLSIKQVSDGFAQAIIANSGIANACTGTDGERDALDMAIYTAKNLEIHPEDVVVASTGVIGKKLPMKKIIAGIQKTAGALCIAGGADAAEAIMTTDTQVKSGAVHIEVGSGTVTVGGIAKGSGMIAPSLATMLAFLTTDAKISPLLLQEALQESLEMSFNRVTVDGQISTNDMVVILANGKSETNEITKGSPDYDLFQQSLAVLCRELAKMIAKDGEGATKLVQVTVTGCPREKIALDFARAIGDSLLVKTALYGKDPNWGRIVSAMGAVKTDLSPEKASISINGVPITKKGLAADFDVDLLRSEMEKDSLEIVVDLSAGSARATVWTCDLSEEYVRINAHYST